MSSLLFVMGVSGLADLALGMATPKIDALFRPSTWSPTEDLPLIARHFGRRQDDEVNRDLVVQLEGCFREPAMQALVTQNLPPGALNNNHACVLMCRFKGYLLAATKGSICACTNTYPSEVRVGESFCQTTCPKSYFDANCEGDNCCGQEGDEPEESAWTVSGVGDIDSTYFLLEKVARKQPSWNPGRTFGQYTISITKPCAAQPCATYLSVSNGVVVDGATTLTLPSTAANPTANEIFEIRQTSNPDEYIVFRPSDGTFLSLSSNGVAVMSTTPGQRWIVEEGDDGFSIMTAADRRKLGIRGTPAVLAVGTGVQQGVFTIKRRRSARTYSVVVKRGTKKVRCTMDMVPDPFDLEDTRITPRYGCVDVAANTPLTSKPTTTAFTMENGITAPSEVKPLGIPMAMCMNGASQTISKEVTSTAEKSTTTTTGSEDTVGVGVEVMAGFSAFGAEFETTVSAEYAHVWRSETSEAVTVGTSQTLSVSFTLECAKGEYKRANFLIAKEPTVIKVRASYVYDGAVVVYDHDVGSEVNVELNQVIDSDDRRFSSLATWKYESEVVYAVVSHLDANGKLLLEEKAPVKVNSIATTVPSDDDYCSPNPCLAGGICQNDTVNRFRCTCQSGYTGRTCEKDRNDCIDQPCMNGAVCRDKLNGYECVCRGKYTGKNCENAPIEKYNPGNDLKRKVRFSSLPGGSITLRSCVNYHRRLKALDCNEDLGTIKPGASIEFPIETYSEQLFIMNIMEPSNSPLKGKTVAVCVKNVDTDYFKSFAHVVFTPNEAAPFGINIMHDENLGPQVAPVLQSSEFRGMSVHIEVLADPTLDKNSAPMQTLVPGSYLMRQVIRGCGGHRRYITYSNPDYYPPPVRTLRMSAEGSHRLKVYDCQQQNSDGAWNCDVAPRRVTSRQIYDYPIARTGQSLLLLAGRPKPGTTGVTKRDYTMMCLSTKNSAPDVAAQLRYVPETKLAGGDLMVGLDRELFTLSNPADVIDATYKRTGLNYLIDANPELRANRVSQVPNGQKMPPEMETRTRITIAQLTNPGRQTTVVGQCADKAPYFVPPVGPIRVPAPPNIAEGKAATQSSTTDGLTANLAVDGNINPDMYEGSCASTGFEADTWFEVDLGKSHLVRSVRLFQSDEPGYALQGFKVTVDGNPCIVNSISDIQCMIFGQKVRISKTAGGGLIICEVAIDGEPVDATGVPAKFSSARQITDWSPNQGAASLAIDRNTKTNWGDNTCSHTTFINQPWWEGTLENSYAINKIVIWNRADCCSERLNDFSVYVDDVLCKANIPSPGPGGVAVVQCNNKLTGSRIKVQLSANNQALTLCEVLVTGTTTLPTRQVINRNEFGDGRADTCITLPIGQWNWNGDIGPGPTWIFIKEMKVSARSLTMNGMKYFTAFVDNQPCTPSIAAGQIGTVTCPQPFGKLITIRGTSIWDGTWMKGIFEGLTINQICEVSVTGLNTALSNPTAAFKKRATGSGRNPMAAVDVNPFGECYLSSDADRSWSVDLGVRHTGVSLGIATPGQTGTYRITGDNGDLCAAGVQAMPNWHGMVMVTCPRPMQNIKITLENGNAPLNLCEVYVQATPG